MSLPSTLLRNDALLVPISEAEPRSARRSRAVAWWLAGHNSSYLRLLNHVGEEELLPADFVPRDDLLAFRTG